ncbi:NnrS multi-domain protein [Streptomyces armeniacus]|uniref:NnrS multi-domain protein n=1 Tax=Streptomyces armeniacus TaxID=83291 RepID=A0A345XMJ3_9ACTN|nr:NnrS multi-domain protein [Streptomyces armeniacus]AXK32859.1 NnrS multi-domain protein [Streptomyces armeniacus]
MLRRRFDRLVLVLIEVRGGERDRETAKSACETRGWRVVDEYGRGEAASAGVLTAAPDARLLSVEVGLYGAARRAERGAAWRVRRLARAYSVEMYVRRAELLRRDRELLPDWYAHTTAHRPDVPVRPAAPPAVRAYGWARFRARCRERLGRYDAGVLVAGTPSEARRLARMPRDAHASNGAHAVRGDDLDVRLDVRPGDGRSRSRSGVVLRREDDLNGRLAALCVWLVVMSLLGVVARDAEGGGRYAVTTLALAAFVAALRVGTRLGHDGRALWGAAVTVVTALFFLLAWVGGPGDHSGLSRGQAFLIVFGVFIGGGLWLLVRQWTWGEWLTVAGPIAATVIGSALLAAGSVKHALYADELSLSPGDLDVPGVWQAIAAVALLRDLYPLLLVPAAYGFAKHFHYVRDFHGATVAAVLLAAFGATALGVVLDSADRAAHATVDAAERGTQPPSYFGVDPSWTCVEPVVPLSELASQGGRLRPERPYVSFGVADGDVVLWDTTTDGPLKLPAKHVRLVPASTPDTACAPPR